MRIVVKAKIVETSLDRLKDGDSFVAVSHGPEGKSYAGIVRGWYQETGKPETRVTSVRPSKDTDESPTEVIRPGDYDAYYKVEMEAL